jgi:hypothetical protein
VESVEHIAEPAEEVTLIVGVGFTVTVTLVVSLQPAADIPTTVNVVVPPGLAFTALHVAQFNPVEGDHV